MTPAELTDTASGDASRPRWSVVLRVIRDARGATREGWAARIGVSRATVQRWEAGARVPDPAAEAAIIAYCRDMGLFRRYDRGPLAGLSLTAELLQDLLAEARLSARNAERGTRSGETDALSAPQSMLRDTPGQARVPHSDNLPAPLTTFVGREEELAELERALGEVRLLTLIGAGGCGKTRLALQLAEQPRRDYAQGVCLVELASLMDPTLVPETVASALGLREGDERPVAEVLQGQLASRHLLLLLDNCEHLLPACADLATTLLRACPRLTILATSREALGIIGEMVWHVRPLSPADATRLFGDRARLYQSDIELSATSEAAVAEICARLDGLPLAIELAAVRVRTLSVEQIAQRLNDRFRLLTGGSRTALPRHQTLRATLDWSYDLLTEPEQSLLRRLAVFAGGFPLDAAELVGGEREQGAGSREQATEGPFAPSSASPFTLHPSPSVLDILSALVDKSLVSAQHRDGVVRYGMLETVRQYAGERLEAAGEAVSAHNRHRDWCLGLVERAEAALHTPREGKRLARLEEEHDNLRAALAWSLTRWDDQGEMALRLAASLARFWEIYGHLSEGRHWLAQALAAGADAPGGVRAKALERAAALAYMQGDYAEARAFVDGCLILYRDLGDAHGFARAYAQSASIALRRDDPAEAWSFLEKSLALNTEVNDTWGTAVAHNGLGILALRHGDYDAAQSHLVAGLALHRELGNREGIANALAFLATVAGEQGNTKEQAALLTEALSHFRELGNKGGVALVLGDLGVQAWLQGEHDRAGALLDESLALYRERAERRGIGRLLAYQGLLAVRGRDYHRAAALCHESIALHRGLGDLWAIGQYLPVLAAAVFGLGEPARAARLLGAAAALRARLDIPLPRAVRSIHDGTLQAMRAALGAPAFASAWAAGQALSPDEVAMEALSESH